MAANCDVGRKLRWMLVTWRNRSFVSGLEHGLKIRLHGDSELCHLLEKRRQLERLLQCGSVYLIASSIIGGNASRTGVGAGGLQLRAGEAAS